VMQPWEKGFGAPEEHPGIWGKSPLGRCQVLADDKVTLYSVVCLLFPQENRGRIWIRTDMAEGLHSTCGCRMKGPPSVISKSLGHEPQEPDP
jgi:hypothetical protein